MLDTRATIRQVALAVIIFGATLVVLLGLTLLVGRPANGTGNTAPSIPGSASLAAPSTSRPSAAMGPSASAGPSAVSDPVLVGAGDIADCASDDDEATAALLDGIEGTVFTAGDNVYPEGTIDTYRDCFASTWGRHRARMHPAPGNHDWQTGALTAYRDYFGAAARGDGGDSWYAYDLGTWRIVVLDSDCDRVEGCGPESRQGRWLTSTLAASASRCTLAIWHHPRFSSGMHGDDTTVDPFWRALYAAGADVVINGHDHDYERFAPQDPDGREDRERGLREFVVGTGGAALRDIERTAPNSELRVSIVHGVLALTLRDGGYDWQFHPSTTDFSDHGTATCH